MEILDLDAIIEKQRGIKFRGQTHVIRELSVKEYAEVMADKPTDNDESKHREWSEKLFKKMMPTITREMIDDMTASQIKAFSIAIMNVVQGEDSGNVAAGWTPAIL